MFMRILLMAALLAGAGGSPAVAQEFRAVTDESEFRELTAGRELRRFGIRLEVLPQGDIVGRGFGYQVTGDWQWGESFFCREMAYGSNAISHNCQLVAINGDTIRFISDRGEGEHADFRLR